MPFKTCQHCGKRNPRFLTHCLFCGEPLLEKRQKAGKVLAILQLIFFLCIAVLFIIYILIPVVQYSIIVGQDFSGIVLKSITESQSPPEYPMNQPATNGDVQVTISSAEDAQITYNSNKFFILSVHLKNLKDKGNIQVTGGNFELIDSKGFRYFPYGVGSQVVYDIRPLESGFVQLTYIIPQDVKGEKVRFTFPAPSDSSRAHEVIIFVL